MPTFFPLVPGASNEQDPNSRSILKGSVKTSESDVQKQSLSVSFTEDTEFPKFKPMQGSNNEKMGVKKESKKSDLNNEKEEVDEQLNKTDRSSTGLGMDNNDNSPPPSASVTGRLSPIIPGGAVTSFVPSAPSHNESRGSASAPPPPPLSQTVEVFYKWMPRETEAQRIERYRIHNGKLRARKS